MHKIIIFGAGNYGRMALEHYGKNNVAFFADNNEEKNHCEICGIQIIDFAEYCRIKSAYRTVIAVRMYADIAKQLKDAGVTEYEYYSPEYQNALERMHEDIRSKAIKGTIVFLGIDDATEMLLADFMRVKSKEEKILLTEEKDSKYIGKNIFNIMVQNFEDVYAGASLVIISSNSKAHYLQVVAEHYCDKKAVINPFLQKRYFETEEIVFNPYKNYFSKEEVTEKDWNSMTVKNQDINILYDLAEILNRYSPLFEHVEIETINRCNGSCSFCPVSAGNDIREKKIMDRELFNKIIDELSDLHYSGRIALFSNNEPFLDPDIIDKHRYARKALPDARMHLFTNGSLLSVEKFREIMNYLDELIIDNYNQKLELNDTSRAIAEYCEEHPELKKRTTIVLRKSEEILTSRGGDAPNRNDKLIFTTERCVLPFRQLIIRPDGKVSLCCNDPYGKMTMGDLSKQSIMEIWNGETYRKIRKQILGGRGRIEHCRTCDTFYF